MTTEIAEPDLAELRARAHPHCAVCGPDNKTGLQLDFMNSGPGEVQAQFDCAQTHEGYPGLLHGGIVSSLIDGAMTNCLFGEGIVAVTATLTMQFRHPVLTEVPASVRAWVHRSSSPRHVLHAEIIQSGQVMTTAVGRFLEQDHLVTAPSQTGEIPTR